MRLDLWQDLQYLKTVHCGDRLNFYLHNYIVKISNLSNDKRYLAHTDIYNTKILKRDAYVTYGEEAERIKWISRKK